LIPVYINLDIHEEINGQERKGCTPQRNKRSYLLIISPKISGYSGRQFYTVQNSGKGKTVPVHTIKEYGGVAV
jgi:hypothetical protein